MSETYSAHKEVGVKIAEFLDWWEDYKPQLEKWAMWPDSYYITVTISPDRMGFVHLLVRNIKTADQLEWMFSKEEISFGELNPLIGVCSRFVTDLWDNRKGR